MEQVKIAEMVERELAAGFTMGAFHRAWLRQNRPFSHSLPRGFHKVGQTFSAVTTNIAPTADFTARNTFTTEVSLLGNTANGAPTQAVVNQFCAIPANDAIPGRMYHLFFGGIYSTTGTPTIIFTPRWGSSVTIGTNVLLGVSQTITTASGVSAQPFFGEFIFTIRTAPPEATAGTGKGHGFVALGGLTTNASVTTMGKTAATIDTTGQGTAGCGLQIGITWGTSSASNTITPENYLIRSLN